MEGLQRNGAWNVGSRSRHRYTNLDPARETDIPCQLSAFVKSVLAVALALACLSVLSPSQQHQQHQEDQQRQAAGFEALLGSTALPQAAAAAAAAASIRVFNSYSFDDEYEQLYSWTHVAEPFKTSVLAIDTLDYGFEATVR